ncbi:hypothetical protein HC752_21870 [Vibrio sp. S9_S30]|uniref:hypothetical protein n=1 Tax=Vibrio sp. S9_S30 TaxID=2720226 RepID=UPI001680B091|nr:hypothetical protein [Vibrio sp. S9_S30]MBD1559595.1 hypothetical protein [Vibrio sp. S9_S30]
MAKTTPKLTEETQASDKPKTSEYEALVKFKREGIYHAKGSIMSLTLSQAQYYLDNGKIKPKGAK